MMGARYNPSRSGLCASAALRLCVEPSPPQMSLLDILKLVGFATGAALHSYLAWLLGLRREGRTGERALFALGLSLAAWHFGNLVATIYELLGVGGALSWLRLADTVAYVALALLPPLLAHAHFGLWELLDAGAPRRFFTPLILFGYVPGVILPWVVRELWREPYLTPIDRLAPLLLPFMLWFVLIFAECAAIDLWLARRIKAVRERRFFRTFGVSLASIAALFLLTYVLGGRHWGIIGSYLDTIARLSSLVPTTIIAYYIYRYRYLELVIRQSLVYAVFAAVVMMIYVYGIRRFSLALEARTSLRSEVVEAVLILGLMFLAGPLRRFTEHYLQRLFVREVGLYRELVAQVGAGAAKAGGYSELAYFVRFAEERIAESLALSDVRLIPCAGAEGPVAELCRYSEVGQWTQIEDSVWLERVKALACYALWREGRVVGLLVIGGDQADLTVEKREVLSVLAGHLAVAIENCQLLEDKVKLERKLAARERLAALGQMAATVAHEIKNPLSSIKSIAQVMREDEAVSRGYGRDLDLITGEIDRLTRSVSQLLSFSRPAVLAQAESKLGDIVAGVVSLARAELALAEHEGRETCVAIDLRVDPQLDGETATALKEILSNLVHNAAQAVGVGGSVRIESDSISDGRLRVAVIDDGPGIPSALQEKVFEPFFTTRQRGTGLGLAIVARRLPEIGASVKLTSPVADNRGTRFELFIPMRHLYSE